MVLTILLVCSIVVYVFAFFMSDALRRQAVKVLFNEAEFMRIVFIKARVQRLAIAAATTGVILAGFLMPIAHCGQQMMNLVLAFTLLTVLGIEVTVLGGMTIGMTNSDAYLEYLHHRARYVFRGLLIASIVLIMFSVLAYQVM